MITTEEYLEIKKRGPDPNCDSKYHKHYEGEQEDFDKIVEYNKALLDAYPWLTPWNRWSGKKITDCMNGEKGYWPKVPDEIPEYNWSYTELDDMPDGWRLAFGDRMCMEIDAELRKFNFVQEYRITQIKEKYATLRWYDNGTPIGKLSEKPIEVVCVPEQSYKWSNEDPAYKDKYIKYVGKLDDYYKYEVYDILDKCLINDIINKYEKLSYHTCINCGKEAHWLSTGWICPYCDNCKTELESNCNFKLISEKDEEEF